jgi:hypothetical protein
MNSSYCYVWGGGSLMVLRNGKHTGELKYMIKSIGVSKVVAIYALEKREMRYIF